MEQRFILWEWVNLQFARNVIIPNIEKNCVQYGAIFPMVYDIFQKNKFIPNALYFHHSYAENDIPMGQEYNKIALIENYKILPDSIQTCPSKILCFFTAYKTQPSEYALHGHHEMSLIQFEHKIPQIIYDELFEIKELPFFGPHKKQICLF